MNKNENSWLKGWLAGIARSVGYEIVPTWRLDGFEFSNHLRDLFERLDIRCVFDVGANAGQYRDFLRTNVGYEHLIISFEPLPNLAELLTAKAATDPNWKVFPYALGNEDGTKIFNITASTQFSSFLSPDNSHIQGLEDKNIVASKATVNVHRLDTVFDDIKNKWGLENIYLKLDTQGFDLEVIKGGENSMKEILGLQSEIPMIQIYDNMPDFFTTLSTYLNKGYQITGMFPVNRDTDLRVIDFDCVMINEPVIRKQFTK